MAALLKCPISPAPPGQGEESLGGDSGLWSPAPPGQGTAGKPGRGHPPGGKGNPPRGAFLCRLGRASPDREGTPGEDRMRTKGKGAAPCRAAP